MVRAVPSGSIAPDTLTTTCGVPSIAESLFKTPVGVFIDFVLAFAAIDAKIKSFDCSAQFFVTVAVFVPVPVKVPPPPVNVGIEPNEIPPPPPPPDEPLPVFKFGLLL